MNYCVHLRIIPLFCCSFGRFLCRFDFRFVDIFMLIILFLHNFPFVLQTCKTCILVGKVVLILPMPSFCCLFDVFFFLPFSFYLLCSSQLQHLWQIFGNVFDELSSRTVRYLMKCSSSLPKHFLAALLSNGFLWVDSFDWPTWEDIFK